MTPPSFSLGLSPDTNKVEERAAKRVKKPSRFIVSPYINKKTATKGKAVQDEMMICSYLFSMEGSELDFIFETKEGNATIRDYIADIAPSLKIESNVIDTYCLVLNHEQGVNNKRKKTKHFFHTGMITTFSMYLKDRKHPKAKYSVEQKPTILRPKWNLDRKFPTEEQGNRCDIIKMRMRFAAKMLTHEINIHREEMSKQALEFAETNKEKKAREELIKEAIKVKKQKQESERISSAI
ncbi:hypothetical protein Tco_0678337 [Tanacetum coccineum]|uniref:Uncharacterized protein n=1 Tax=Tanacetum coccineum TaxID=301880 RepID=A0ABQ4XFQ5_9ASTR